ncbi:hypothetical protein [Lutibacter sp.]|uniref:hypothetical protein n=1 Tax=Lutibacter sp. TaxID=1925666 RepID=UPI001A35192C|nr:hypothetical protein [Lutibacter sp.]MBI9041251.1 hypothetical protein [Lutibacter sp.]
MKKSNIILLILMSLLFINCSNKNILLKIENFKASANSDNSIIETYDYRLKNSTPLPNKLTDVFAYDVWLILTNTIQLKGISPSNIKKEDILKVFEIYKNEDYKKIIGFRPYTQSSFVKSLNNDDLLILSENLESHIRENGIWEKP